MVTPNKTDREISKGDFRWRCKEKEHSGPSVLFGSNIGIGIGTEFRLREGEIIAGETGKGNV